MRSHQSSTVRFYNLINENGYLRQTDLPDVLLWGAVIWYFDARLFHYSLCFCQSLLNGFSSRGFLNDH